MYIPKPKNYQNGTDSIKIYLNFDKNEEILYNNIFLEEENIVIKIPLLEVGKFVEKLKFERFCLNNSTFLITI